MATATAYKSLDDQNYRTFLKFNFEDQSKRLALEKTTVNGKKHTSLIVVDPKDTIVSNYTDDLKKVAKFVQDHQVYWRYNHRKTLVKFEIQTAYLKRITMEYNKKALHVKKIKLVYSSWKLKITVHCKDQKPRIHDFDFDRLSTNKSIYECVGYAIKQKIRINYKGTFMTIIPSDLYTQYKYEGFEKGLALELPDQAWLKDDEPGKDREINLYFQKINKAALVRFAYEEGLRVGYDKARG